jgi:polar amino acid transport system substrate-binding protein
MIMIAIALHPLILIISLILITFIFLSRSLNRYPSKIYFSQKISGRILFTFLALMGGLLTLLITIQATPAQIPEKITASSITVATKVIPPFVIEDKGKLSGFSVDLWRNIAKEIGLQSNFIVKSSVVDLLSEVELKKADLGIAAVSITAEREEKFDFSLPMFGGGLQILVPHTDKGGIKSGLSQMLQTFLSPTLFQLISVAIALIFFAAHIIWLSERHHKEGIIPKDYFPGILKASWWAAATLATQADEMPKGILGRFIAIIWMFIGIIFVAYFTATATTSLTVQQLQGDIKGVEDLPGKVVVTTKGSTAAAYLKEEKIQVLEVEKIEQAYQAILSKNADAIVFDAPVLLYYAAHDGKGKVEIVGNIFREENYGIVMANNSSHRKQINKALLTLKENGTYQALYDKWFKGN